MGFLSVESLVFKVFVFFLRFYFFLRDPERERKREAETQAGSIHWEPDVGFDPGFPGSRPGPKAGAKPLRHPGIPMLPFLMDLELEVREMMDH